MSLNIDMVVTAPSRWMTPWATGMGSDVATINVDSIPGTFAARGSTTADSNIVTTMQGTNTPAIT